MEKLNLSKISQEIEDNYGISLNFKYLKHEFYEDEVVVFEEESMKYVSSMLTLLNNNVFEEASHLYDSESRIDYIVVKFNHRWEY